MTLSNIRLRCASLLVPIITVGLIIAASSGEAKASNLVRQALCDLRVLYVFDEPENIDWPTLYYLNDEYGCRIDLVSLKRAELFRYEMSQVKNARITMYRFAGNDTTGGLIDSACAHLFAERKPDIVIFGQVAQCKPCTRFAAHLDSLTPDSASLFNIEKIYRSVDTSLARSVGSAVIDSREQFGRFRLRMEDEIPQLLPWFHTDAYTSPLMSRYDLVRRNFTSKSAEADFTSGLALMRLPGILDSLLPAGALKDALQKRARNVISLLRVSENSVGQKSVEQLLSGYNELLTLRDQTRNESRLSPIPHFKTYMDDLLARTHIAVMNGIGLTWDSKIILRDSPEGPKLKLRLSLTSAGPEDFTLSQVRFLPYWDTTAVLLDSTDREVAPHQTYVREYLVDIDRAKLEAEMPESLLFAADIVCGKLPFPVTTSIPIWETPDLSISFQPNFFFVPPVAQLNVDKVVSSMNWKAIIHKPTYYYGKVDIHLETPKGVFAGAYQTQLTLEKGRSTETMRIPFSVSNLFEPGVQQQTLTLSVAGKQLAADTGIIRIAACHIEDTIKIGFLPDSTGLLEDVLRMTGAGFQPLTDRSLTTADLDAYNVIVIGSGSFRENPSLRSVKGRFEDYLRDGGSIVILGQPQDWPEGALPVDFSPNLEVTLQDQILNRLPDANLLRKPYGIAVDGLTSYFSRSTEVASAVITPSEKVLVTPSGGTLLSVSRLGKGRIVYCGLPILEMIAALNIDAIHLFANLLNY